MAPSSSSTKKAARLAQKGKGQKVRFQGGTLFPMIVAIVLVSGLALVAYARESRPTADASAPQIDDHWHHVYGFYLCDTWFQLNGDGEALDANGRPTNIEYARSGIHSHDDGLIHWHPFSSLAIGSRARLGVFLDVYDVEITRSRLEFPADQRAFLPYQNETGVFENGETECEIRDDDGNVTGTETGELKAVVWENFSDTGEGQTFIADYDNIRLDQDAMVVVIAFVPNDEDVVMPPWAPEFEERALNDVAQLPPDELFSGVEIDDDGDITIDTGVPSEDAPADDAPADGDTSTTEP